MFSEEPLAEFVWSVFSDENPEYDSLLLETYGMICRDEPTKEIEYRVIEFIKKSIAGADDGHLPSVSKTMSRYLDFHVDWDLITARVIREANDMDEVGHAYVRTVARSHAIGEMRAYIDIYATLYGSDGLYKLVDRMDGISDPFNKQFPLPKPVRSQMERVCVEAVRAFRPRISDARVFGFSYESEFISYGEKFAREYINELTEE